MVAMDRREIEQLWTLPLEDFTRSRDELAKRAREEGDQESAKEIKALRKPSVAAWAVNQLARERASEIKKLLKLGEALREAQRKTLEGGGADALRSKATERRRLVDGLAEAAGALLEAAGHPSTRATLDRISGTLTAATVDPDVAQAVGSGTVQRDEPPPSGLEELAALVPSGGTRSRSSGGTASAAERSRTARAKERVAKLEEEASDAEERARELRTESDRAAREADRAARRAAEAEERAARLRDRAEEARRSAERS
jgi:hypothetical protein